MGLIFLRPHSDQAITIVKTKKIKEQAEKIREYAAKIEENSFSLSLPLSLGVNEPLLLETYAPQPEISLMRGRIEDFKVRDTVVV